MAGPSGRPADNRHELVRIAVAGRVADAYLGEAAGYDSNGQLRVLPATGGVALGVHVGDAVRNSNSDHLLAGASIQDAQVPITSAGALHLFACVGNLVRAASGESLGVVAAKRGGMSPHSNPHLVGVEVPEVRIHEVAPGQAVVVECFGRGLALLDWPDVALLNMDPAILDALPIGVEGSQIVASVRATVPSTFAGAGLGMDPWDGDLDVAGEPGTLPSDLRFGDLIAFDALDGRFSRFGRSGFLAVGIVAHGPSPSPGHGVGVTLLLSGSTDRIGIRIDQRATLSAALRTMSESV